MSPLITNFISIDFGNFVSLFSQLLLNDLFEEIYQTLEKVFHRKFNTFNFVQINSVARHPNETLSMHVIEYLEYYSHGNCFRPFVIAPDP